MHHAEEVNAEEMDVEELGACVHDTGLVDMSSAHVSAAWTCLVLTSPPHVYSTFPHV